jgi:Polysaccharide lyase
MQATMRAADLRRSALLVGISLALAAIFGAGFAASAEAVRNLTASGISDTAATQSPIPFWGEIDCQSSSRHSYVDGGGDPHPTATGAGQGNDSYRELTVYDGDDIWGERCELGENNHRSSPVAVYREGQRRLTYISLRLPGGFDLSEDTWQVVMQMKQAGPSANSGGTPVLELDAYGGQWRLRQSKSRGYAEDSRELWAAPAQTEVWTRFAFDIRYSSKPGRGRISVGADLNADGDFADAGEQSPRMRTYTLKRETRGGGRDGIAPGRSIPSHLRAGLYHDDGYSCAGGCSVDVDNVQVLRP